MSRSDSERKLKVGDRVEVVSDIDTIYSRKPGETGIIESTRNGISEEYTVRFGEPHPESGEFTRWFREEEIRLAPRRGRPAKAKPTRYLLKHGVAAEPVEEFVDLKDVKGRIVELSKNFNFKWDSIWVYEVKSKIKVELESKVAIKGI